MHAGGGRMFSLIKEHSKRHSVYVISFVADEEINYIGELERYCREVIPVGRSTNTVIEQPSIVPRVILEQFEHREMYERIAAFMAAREIDVVTVEYVVMSRYRPGGCPSVLVVHEFVTLAAYRDWKNSSGAQKIRSFFTLLKTFCFENKVFKKYDHLVSLTPKEKRLMNFFFPGLKVELAPMGADGRIFFPRPAVSETNDLLFVGNFWHAPNVDAVTYFCDRIFPLILRELPGTKLTIVGYKSRDKLQDFIRYRNVVIAGRVPDMGKYLAESKVFINPVRLGSGMRGKLLEAIAMAKPVISTSIGADGLDARDGESIVIADTPVDFARRAIDLLKSKDMRERIGARAYELFREKYDWRRVVEKMEELYGEIAKK